MDSKTFMQRCAQGIEELWTNGTDVNAEASVPFDLNVLLETLQQLPQGKASFLGRVFLDEENFYRCTTQLRLGFPDLFADPHQSSGRVLRDLESLSENGKAHVFGRVLIDLETYAQLNAALRQSIGEVKTTIRPSGENMQAEEIIRIAHMQAQTIIEAAHQEAQRIVEEARRRAQ